MNIQGVGIDIVSLERIKNIPNKDRFAEYILTESELDGYYNSNDRVQFLGSRLAVKEAVIKSNPESLTYHDFYISKKGLKPVVNFVDSSISSKKILVSISHELDNAVGYALAYKI